MALSFPHAPAALLAPLAPMGAALRLPEFRLLWLSLLPGTLGMMMAMVAFGFVAYELSGSTTTLATVNAGWGVSMFLLSPLAGSAADRFPRRNVLLMTQGLLGVTAVASCILIWSGVIQVWHLVAITLVQGTAFAFNIPARQALIAELVGQRDLANALALYNAGLNFNRVAGPAIGGALLTIPAIGAGGVFGIMAGLYLLVLAMLARLPATHANHPRPAAPPASPGTGPRTAVRIRAGLSLSSLGRLNAGLAYVAARPALRTLMLLAFLPVMLGTPYQSLMPAVAARVFHVDASGLGALLTANGVGALAGSLLLAALSGRAALVRLQLASGLLLGVGLVAFALNGAFTPALALVAVVGGASAMYTAANSTLLMSAAPPDYHGRVMGVYMMTVAATPLFTLPVGWLADSIGLPSALALCGTLAALSVAVLARGSRAASGAVDIAGAGSTATSG